MTRRLKETTKTISRCLLAVAAALQILLISIDISKKSCIILIFRREKGEGLQKNIEDLKNEIATKEKILQEKKTKAIEDSASDRLNSENRSSYLQKKEEEYYQLESQKNQLGSKVCNLQDRNTQLVYLQCHLIPQKDQQAIQEQASYWH